MPVKLDRIVPWGRSFDEYVRMFALSDQDLDGSILDCAAGPSSFNAEMHARGKKVISIDPLYAFSGQQIRDRVQQVRDTMIDQVREQPSQFVWDYIRSPEHLEEIRIGAMERFLDDFGDGSRDRYIDASLPEVPAGQFDLALCSHFLFLYSDHLDARFHVDAIEAMLSVAREVRIFPVTDLAGRASPHLDEVREHFSTRVEPVEYELLRGANQMLRCFRSPLPPIVPGDPAVEGLG
jgi:hypothetical protein